jgi:hypothetical protein
MSCRSGSCGTQKTERRGSQRTERRGVQHSKDRVAAVSARNREDCARRRANFARNEEAPSYDDNQVFGE